MKKKIVCIVLLFSLLSPCILYEALLNRSISVNIIAGKQTDVDLNINTNITTLSQENRIISVNGELSDKYELKNTKKINFFAFQQGNFILNINILGVIPAGSINVSVIPVSKVYIGGDAIGVKLNTEGVIAVGFEHIELSDGTVVCPAKEGGIKEGDVIKSLNGIRVNTAQDFRDVVNTLEDKEIPVELVRKGKMHTLTIPAVYSADTKSYLIGLWVRDNIAGIGTLSYISADKKQYAALGHSVVDITSGITVPVGSGELVKADIISIVKGKSNAPGELKAVINAGSKALGNVRVNNDFGIYGEYYADDFEDRLLCEYATQDEIELGDATIITSVNGERREYTIEIVQITRQTAKSSKSMKIKVTDKQLLQQTGGIVQGMSGSPIMQNSKIIGALTHVSLSDPKTGYAIFIEWMIKDLLDEQISTNFATSA